MPHLDEGTLHALLDGELDLAEVKEIQTHLGACTACGSRLQDVKQFHAEADQLVGAMETPAGAARARLEPAPPPQVPIAPPPPSPQWREPVWDSAPQLLLPEDPEAAARRRRWNRRFRWAALILIVLGLGQGVKSLLTPGVQTFGTDGDVISSVPETQPPVVSPEETIRPEVPVAKEAAPVNRTRPTRPAPAPQVFATKSVADSAPAQNDTAVAAEQDTAMPEPPPEVVASAGRTDSEPAPSRETTRVASDDIATRQAAAAALEELDRERIRSRANAATAALPPARPEPAPAAEAPPPPRTLEQKSQIYLRIGLDEAAKQLGRPMHVIEAMSPEFIGLAQGRLVTGADPNRPVVRVVYRDTRGRMILLDQQRLRTGQAPGAASGNLRWTLGDVMLYLHGEPGGDVLRNLQRRVR